MQKQHKQSSITNLRIHRNILFASASVLFTFSISATAAPQSNEDVVQSLNALGLNSESLACIDVIGDEPSIVLDRLETEYASYEQYLNLQEEIIVNQRIVHNANATLRDYADDIEAQQALDQAQVQIILLSNQVQATKTNLISTILDGLADSSLISPVAHAQGPSQQLPPAYRLAVDTIDEAKLLVWALKMEAMAQASEFYLSSEASQAISLAHGQLDVQSALVRVVTFEQPNQLTISEWALTH